VLIPKPEHMTPVGEPRRVQVATIEDQQQIREGLRILIHGTPGYRCVGAYATIEDALPGPRVSVCTSPRKLRGQCGISWVRPY
jgi:hypothetical protein